MLDTCDVSVERQFLENIAFALGDRKLDYVIVNHVEPDHCATLGTILEKYPECWVVASAQAVRMITQFHGVELSSRFQAVKEGDTLCTGRHVFRFVMAPMVHWPEVMMTYDETDRILYSADAFGRFGALSGNVFEDAASLWEGHLSSARRYYANIVGKYGAQVGSVLKKASALPIEMICPLHGPVLRENLGFYLDKYVKWSSYEPEDDSIVIAYGSVYGNTANVAEILATKLSERGARDLRIYDVSKTHYSKLVAEAFRVGTLVFAAPTVDGGLFTEMELVLKEIRSKNLANRRVALIENGTWAPMAAKLMASCLEGLKNVTILEEKCTIRSAVTESNLQELDAMANAIMRD